MKINFLIILLATCFFSPYLKANNCLIIYQNKNSMVKNENLKYLLYDEFTKKPNSNRLLLVNNTIDKYLSEINRTHKKIIDDIETYGADDYLSSAQSLWKLSIESHKNNTSSSAGDLSALAAIKKLSEEKITEICLKNSEHCISIFSFGAKHYEDLQDNAIKLKEKISIATQELYDVNQDLFSNHDYFYPAQKVTVENTIHSKITQLEQLENQLNSAITIFRKKIKLANDEIKNINDFIDFISYSKQHTHSFIDLPNKLLNDSIDLKERTPEGIFITGFIKKYYDKNFHDSFLKDFITIFNQHFGKDLSDISITDFIEINLILAEKKIYFSGNKLGFTNKKMIEHHQGTISINFPKEMYPLITNNPVIKTSQKLRNEYYTDSIDKLDLIISNFFLLLPAVKFDLYSNTQTYNFLFSILGEFIKAELAKRNLTERFLSPTDDVIVGKLILSQIDLMKERFKLDLLTTQRNLLRRKDVSLLPIPFDGHHLEYNLPFDSSEIRIVSKVFSNYSHEELQKLLFSGSEFKTINFTSTDLKEKLQSSFSDNIKFVIIKDIPYNFFINSKNERIVHSFPNFHRSFGINIKSIRTPYIVDSLHRTNITYDIILSKEKSYLKSQYNLEYINLHE